ncbi:MAG: hypothetical protein U5K54_26415 [Cytophagales bacterium]|nr:hypothetical protein [Cytophagales bacterium]
MIEIREAELMDIPAMREVAISSYSDTFSAFNAPENMEAFFKSAYSLEALEKEFHETDFTYLSCVGERSTGGICTLARM